VSGDPLVFGVIDIVLGGWFLRHSALLDRDGMWAKAIAFGMVGTFSIFIGLARIHEALGGAP